MSADSAPGPPTRVLSRPPDPSTAGNGQQSVARAPVARDHAHPASTALGRTILAGGTSVQTRQPMTRRDHEVPGRGDGLSSTDQIPSVPLPSDYAQPERPPNPRIAALGYASVDAQQREHSRRHVYRQMKEIGSACQRRGLCLLDVVHERVSPQQHSLERPGLRGALARLAAGEAGGLVVLELSEVAQALPDLGRVLEWLVRHDVRFVAVAPKIDTDDEAGQLAVRTLIEVSRWERQLLAERTRAGMRAARRKGPARVADYPALRERIAGMRAAGMTLQAIADQLNAEGIHTIRGGAKWRPSSVQAAAGYQRPPTSDMRDLQLREPNGHNTDDGEV